MKGRYRWPLVIVVVLVVGLVALRMALPGLVRDYLNEQLADMGAYRGHIEDVDLALWRGAYTINGLTIVKAEEETQVPFFRADALDLSVSWRALWKGAIVAEAVFMSPELNFVDTPGEGGGQSGEGTDWRMAMQELLPIELNLLRVVNGRVHFRNFSSQPPVDLEISELDATATNLSNADRREGAQVADIDATGLMLNQASTEFHASIDPLGDMQDFTMQLRVTGIDLTRLNELTEAYGNFNFESGSGDFVMELEANDGQLQGFAKPLLDNVDILDLEEDAEEGVLNAAWEALVGGVGWLFRNHPEDRLASQIEIRGNLDQQDISAWQAFVSVLHNAFVDAYQANFKKE
ncbi:DUF748 domain-containing protein [Halomonas sp. HP20-15]|uniref:DUF748 domain-containing protein n=1 Tax=Halomonas sp. HP20-15 TaxID=3085901 RepID=UPI002981461C|nr:DUF748 domain-containing protein [Halomonas sp. HP20-15]MDW5378740.1 DUF748 domain-containing protein [Halomonas sp. HP20-15]